MTDDAATDAAFMAMALRLAARGLGQVWPNPAVGCVITRAGRVVGRGWTQPGGRPHAETEALERAGSAARDATAYVTLEPCSHFGHTPPCADALVTAGVGRVVVALGDPDSRVNGRGVARLRAAGIPVTEGVMTAAARDLNAGFLLRVTANRPLVTLKAATTLDGRIATASGESRWITASAARARGHGLRATHDAILVGSGTARADDPLLTCRLPGWSHRSPVRVVLDSTARLSPSSRLVSSASEVPVWVICAASAPAERLDSLEAAGATMIPVEPDSKGRPRIAAVLQALAGRGITRVLLEGGGALAASFLAADAVDRLVWFQAPMVLGGDGRPAVGALGLEALATAPRWRLETTQWVGDDVMITAVRSQNQETAKA